MIDILAIGAHPDDVELAASGTLLLHKNLGHSIAIVDLTQGELGTRGNAEIRMQEAALSSEILGLDERQNLGLKDGFFAEDEASLLKLIVAVRYFKPRIVLANSIMDRHPDHGRSAGFSSRACFLSGLSKIITSYGGSEQEAHRPSAVYHYIQDRYIHPDLVTDITPYFSKKMEAVLAFQSQFYDGDGDNKGPQTPISGKDFLDFLEARAREFGRLIGVKYGEGFNVEKPVGVSDLFNLQ